MNGAFFLRNVPMVVLFGNYDSEKANRATIARIAVTIACAIVLPRLGHVGAAWGLFALTFGVLVEYVLTWHWARPYVARLRLDSAPVPGGAAPGAGEVISLTLEQFKFTMPLSLGGFLLMLSPLIVATFVGRSADPGDMLAIHYVTLGVANPVSFAALRMQTVAIQFPPERPGDRRLLVYAVVAGAILGLVPLLFATPAIGDWYFGVYQNVPPRILGTTRLAVRGRVEGLAALWKCPSAIMSGQIAYTVGLFTTLAILLPLGVAGWAMAVSAIFVAPVVATAAMYLTLRYKQDREQA